MLACSTASTLALRAASRESACLTIFFFSSRRRHTRFDSDWSSDVCSSDLGFVSHLLLGETEVELYEVRRILEASAAALAAGRIDAAEKDDLGQSLERMRVARTVEELVEADRKSVV